MSTQHERTPTGRSAWLVGASFVALAVGLVGFFSTTELQWSLQTGGEHSSFGFNFASSMDWWQHGVLVAVMTGGAVLGGLGVRSGRWRALAWLAVVSNAVGAILLATFLVAAYAQRPVG